MRERKAFGDDAFGGPLTRSDRPSTKPSFGGGEKPSFRNNRKEEGNAGEGFNRGGPPTNNE